MMDLRIVEGSGAKLSYVVGGAKLQCNFGSQQSQLQVPEDHGIYINDKPLFI